MNKELYDRCASFLADVEDTSLLEESLDMRPEEVGAYLLEEAFDIIYKLAISWAYSEES